MNFIAVSQAISHWCQEKSLSFWNRMNEDYIDFMHLECLHFLPIWDRVYSQPFVQYDFLQHWKKCIFRKLRLWFYPKVVKFRFPCVSLTILKIPQRSSPTGIPKNSTEVSPRFLTGFPRYYGSTSSRISEIPPGISSRNSFGVSSMHFLQNFLWGFPSSIYLGICTSKFLRRFPPGIPPGISSGNFSWK